jgi:hypothetical protein
MGALGIVFGLAFFGGGATVGLVLFALLPLWAIITVGRWSARRGEG